MTPDRRATCEARVGTVLDGRFELRRLVGIGATGAVYEAFHRYMEQSVALKLLHADLASDREYVRRFLREVKATTAIRHPGIATVYDAGRNSDGLPYLVTELIDGVEMAELMHRGPLAHDDVFEIGVQVLDALAAAHDQGIVHRDVKPDNVFLIKRPSGPPGVKLIDFGIAKRLFSESTVSLTETGKTVGTPDYMSPEQARAEPVDHRTDIWSAGATLFHAFGGSPPFVSKNIAVLLGKIATERPMSLGTLCPELDPEISRVIDRALEPKLDARWQTARDMANALAVVGYAEKS